MIWLGLNGLTAMALLQLGLQREKAGRVGILNNSIVIFTYIFQVSLTDDKGNGSDLKFICSAKLSYQKPIKS